MKSFLVRAGSVAAIIFAFVRTAFGADEPVRLVRLPNQGMQPQAIPQDNSAVQLVYLEGDPKGCNVICLQRPPGQTNFLPGLRVNSQPGSAIAIGTVRGAQIALGRDRRLHAVWNGSDQAQPRDAANNAPLLYARMNDKRDGFEEQRNLMTSTRHLDGGGSVAADNEGNVYVLWHGHIANGPQDELHRAVFLAKSTDDGKTFAPERLINPEPTGACACCGLKAFADAKGAVAVLYRSADETGSRDVTLLISRDHGASFQSSKVGSWKIPTCPMSTMALGQDSKDSLLAMWETSGRVHYEFLQDAPTGEQQKVNDGPNQKHPAFAIGRNGDILQVWTEATGWAKGGDVAWQIVDKEGIRKARGRAQGVPVWGGVAAVAEKDGFTIFY